MLKKISHTVLKKNIEAVLSFAQDFFPYYFVLTFTCMMVELVSYNGFIAKNTLLPVEVLSYSTVALILALTVLQSETKKSSFFNHFKLLIRLATISYSLLYYILISLEVSHFQNYVYSQFHVQLSAASDLLKFLILTSVFSSGMINMLYCRIVRRVSTLKKPQLIRSTLEVIFMIVLLWVSFAHGFSLVQYTYTAVASYRTSLSMGYQEKLVRQLGGDQYSGWIATYGKFITDTTPESAKIFIPPQLQSWQMEGNEWYFRWFVYPRTLLGSRTINDPIPEDAEYILIAHGTWVWGASDYVWPKSAIPASKIDWIKRIDRKSKETTLFQNTDYIPNTKLDDEDWGIIKLK